jgi:NAD(P)-dependent dehydrogenase (short-subunit alcohol dehydrogenase family)
VTRNMDPNGKIVLVTGSTDGVGRLVARRLADQGARVLTTDGTATEANR